jgi:hypothetical protein
MSLKVFTRPVSSRSPRQRPSQQPPEAVGRGVAKQQSDLAVRKAGTAQAVGPEFRPWALPAFFRARQTGGAGGDEGVEGGGQRLGGPLHRLVAAEKKRLSQPLPSQGPSARPGLTSSAGLRKTGVQRTGGGTPPGPLLEAVSPEEKVIQLRAGQFCKTNLRLPGFFVV